MWPKFMDSKGFITVMGILGFIILIPAMISLHSSGAHFFWLGVDVWAGSSTFQRMLDYYSPDK